jgi:hypothetical protein
MKTWKRSLFYDVHLAIAWLMAQVGCSWALPLLDVKEMVLWRMNADVGQTEMSLILLLDFDKDKGLGELAGGGEPVRKPTSRIDGHLKKGHGRSVD